jgi:NAD(P)-dependent dehydrogenase (short-subunit alcohol dehydrogenase family)
LKELAGKVAVVTGAASGMGFSIAERCVTNRMRVVLADVEENALEQAADKLAAQGEVIAVPTDVSQAQSVDELYRQAEAFGPVQLLCNNAGVGGASFGSVWQTTLADWQWVLEVNLWGVIHGLRAFLPAMVERNEGHVVNTASIAGLIPGPFGAPYVASKHAVVGISLSLHQELALLNSNVKVSVLCPGWIQTSIMDSQRNWPDRLGPRPASTDNELVQLFDSNVRALVEGGMPPAAVAEQVLDAVHAERFWILPNAEEFGPVITEIAASAVERRDPPLPSFG